MEDWGATSCNENSVLYNDNMSILEQSRALNIAHEFAHIWFGDLVTTSSWSELWLNEGFARFMDVKTQELYPEHDAVINAHFLTLHKALWRDDDLTAKPLSWQATKPTDAYEILNSINYEKGGSVLRTVQNTIGENRMQQVMQEYIKRYQYRNVVSQNFVDVLQNFVDFNATDFLLGFVKQSGYPVVTVQDLGNSSHFLIKQQRFLRWNQTDSKNQKWTIPIKYKTNLNTKSQLVWFNRKKSSLLLKFPKPIKWIKLNPKQGSYYRSNYPTHMWLRFSKLIKNFKIEDRIHLLDESMALVRSGHLDCAIAFTLMNYLQDEEGYEPWMVAQNNLAKIKPGFFQNNMDITPLKEYVIRLIDKQYKRNKWTVEANESFRTKRTRATIFNLACYYGHKDCRDKVSELWTQKEALPIDIRNIVLINNPNKEIDYNRTESDNYESLSYWFGADLSLLTQDPTFKWPKHIMDSCYIWLRQRKKY